MKKLGLYIHIPFCIQKCKYCDFLSFEHIKEEDMNRYADAAAAEIENKSAMLKDHIIDTIFLGGGTPSVLNSESLEKIIQAVFKYFKVSDSIEFTIEANPKTFNKEKLSHYLHLGINRLSMGVQSLEDDILKILGRIHSSQDFYRSFYDAREAGFSNVNTDIMFSIPKQSEKDWKNTLHNILELKPEHISFYSLKIEENTPFHEMQNKGIIEEYDEDTDRKMYWYAVNEIKNKGYIHYEISNAALEGYECRHNLKYWSMEEYLGIGAGAHSFISGIRSSNETDLNKYIHNVNNKIDTTVWSYQNSAKDNISEYIFTGLRKTDGICLSAFEKEFGIEFNALFEKEMKEMIQNNYLESLNNRIRLTDKGLDVSNNIMARFLL